MLVRAAVHQQCLKRRLCSSAVVFVLAQDQQLPMLTGYNFFTRHEKHSMLLSTCCNVVFTRASHQLVALLLSCSAATKTEAGPSRKKRKGGIQQRQAAAVEQAADESALYAFLMTKYAQGLLSAALCHSILMAAARDLEAAKQGTEFPEIDRAVKVKLSKNVQRCLDQDLRKIAALPKPMEADIPMQGGPTDCASSAILLPHETVHGFFNSAQGWLKCILPDTNQLPGFWNVFRHHPCMENHPVLSETDFDTTFIPLCLHGDEVPAQGVGKIWSQSALQFSFNSLLASAAGRLPEDCSLFVWGVFEKFVLPTTEAALGTMDVFFEILQWSFRCLYEGKWSRKDWRGIANLDFQQHFLCVE